VLLSLGGIALPLLAILAACDLTVANTVSLDSPCSSEDDCPSGQACYASGEAGSTAGTCQNKCNTRSDCAPGLACMDYGGQGVCVAPGPDASPGVDAMDASEGAVGADAANDGPGVTDGANDAANDAGDATVGPSDAANDADATVDADAASDVPEDVGDAADDADATEDVSDDADGASDDVFVCNPEPAPSTIVLFGGVNDTGELGDTWIWDGQSWSQVDAGDAGDPDASAHPAARHSAAMSSGCGYAVMFGGTDQLGSMFPGAWQWNGAAWQPAPTTPSWSESASAGTLDGVIYLFGGNDSSRLANNSLFAWSGGNWATAAQTPPAGLAPRFGAIPLTHSPGGLVLTGGFDVKGQTLGDTWLLTDTTWQQVGDTDGSAPLGIGAYASAASWGNFVVVFGGEDIDGTASDVTWIWDGSSWSSPPQPSRPAARYAATMASLNGQVVLFGGLDTNFDLFGDTWIWNGSWTPGPDAGPPPRSNATMASY
jgi:hypothetical protein